MLSNLCQRKFTKFEPKIKKNHFLHLLSRARCHGNYSNKWKRSHGNQRRSGNQIQNFLQLIVSGFHSVSRKLKRPALVTFINLIWLLNQKTQVKVVENFVILPWVYGGPLGHKIDFWFLIWFAQISKMRIFIFNFIGTYSKNRFLVLESILPILENS